MKLVYISTVFLLFSNLFKSCTTSINDDVQYKKLTFIREIEVVVDQFSGEIYFSPISTGCQTSNFDKALDSMIEFISDTAEIVFYTKTGKPIDRGMVSFLVICNRYEIYPLRLFNKRIQIVLSSDFDSYDLLHKYFQNLNRDKLKLKIQTYIAKYQNGLSDDKFSK